MQNLIPIAQGFRYGEKFLPGFLVCLVALAAVGADRLAGDPGRARRAALGSAALSGLLVLAWVLTAAPWPGGLLQGVEAGAEMRAHLVGGLPQGSYGLLCLHPDGGSESCLSAVPSVPIPEPATTGLLAAGLAVLGMVARRRRTTAYPRNTRT